MIVDRCIQSDAAGCEIGLRIVDLGINVNGIRVLKLPKNARVYERVYARIPLKSGANGELFPVITFRDMHLDAAVRRAVVDAYKARVLQGTFS